MRSFLKIFITCIAVLGFAAMCVVGLAFIAGVRNPIAQYERKNNVSPLQTYEEKRSEQEEKEMKEALDILAKTGSCAGCNFNAKKGEEEKRDLYQAIQSAKSKGLAIDLSGAGLFMVKLAGVDLSNANVSGADLLMADLAGANLSGANLQGACLEGANFQDANMSGADLTGAFLSLAKLHNANLTNAVLSKVVSVFNTRFLEANLTNADLTGATLINATTVRAKFVGADLRGARIDMDFAKNADLTNAKLDNWFIRAFNRLTFWTLEVRALIAQKTT